MGTCTRTTAELERGPKNLTLPVRVILGVDHKYNILVGLCKLFKFLVTNLSLLV